MSSNDYSSLKMPVQLSKTLRWHMSYIGEVPMMFYVPECGEDYIELK